MIVIIIIVTIVIVIVIDVILHLAGHHQALEQCIATACWLANFSSLLLLHFLLLCLLLLMMRPDHIAAQVGVNYDPMVAKVIARGPDRHTALARLHTALSDLQVHLCCF
jgi:hypothetical protein